ncbi:hypothetical protein HK101_006685, partial [Irineochytrium annulatum]
MEDRPSSIPYLSDEAFDRIEETITFDEEPFAAVTTIEESQRLDVDFMAYCIDIDGAMELWGECVMDLCYHNPTITEPSEEHDNWMTFATGGGGVMRIEPRYKADLIT